MPSRIETLAPALSDAEEALLRRAFEGWEDDDRVSDAEVAQVKALFARVFGVTSRLAGHAIADALLLWERDRCGTYYAAVRADAAWAWKRVDVVPEEGRVMVRTEILDPSIEFDTLVACLSH